MANAQLLEMRYYDELLDDELPRMYTLVEATPRGLNVLAARRYASLAVGFIPGRGGHGAHQRVDNALQVTEDVNPARVDGAAPELFACPRSAPRGSQARAVRDTYTALYDEASSIRAELLEVAIVVLIPVQIVLAVLRR